MVDIVFWAFVLLAITSFFVGTVAAAGVTRAYAVDPRAGDQHVLAGPFLAFHGEAKSQEHKVQRRRLLTSGAISLLAAIGAGVAAGQM